MIEHASVDEGVEVAKRVEQGREIAAESKEASEGAAAGTHRAVPRGGQNSGGQSSGGQSSGGQSSGGRNGSADWLGRGLRRLYQGTVNEPIPEKFRDLLSRLDEQGGDPSDADAPARAHKAGDQP